MSMRADGGFMKAGWHWLVLGACALALGGALFYAFGEWSVDPKESADEAVARGAARSGTGAEGVTGVDLSDYQRAARAVKAPTPLVSVPGAKGSFLASERRVHCKFCAGALVPPEKEDAKAICPFCGKEQPQDERKTAAVRDADEDGLPDEWEKKFGFKTNDASDAQADPDGDLFTNAEEFEAKTDPTDRRSHPDYLDSLKLALPLKQTFMPFHFTGVNKTPSGLKYQFKDPSRVREYDRGIYSVYEGKEIGASGFVATKYEPLMAKRKMGGGMEKKVDVSVATVTRKADGKAVRLVIDQRKTPIDVQARLVFARGAMTKEFVVVPGDTIDLNGEKYKVKALKPLAKGAEVILENVLTGVVREVRALEP